VTSLKCFILTVASESKDEDFKDAVADLFAHMDKHEQGHDSQEEETKKTPVEEPAITAEELVPLGDLKTALPTHKSLLNARVIFVIGKLN
jgi:hypothetical protein